MRPNLASMASATTAMLAVVVCAAGIAAAQAPYPQLGTVLVQQGDDPRWASPAFDDRGWQAIHWYRIDPQRRLLWVRAHVPLPAPSAFERAPLAVQVSALAAYEVYWNGEHIGGSGTPGPSEDAERPGPLDTVHPVPARLLREGDNVLALRMSSFHLRRTLGGPTHWLAVGDYAEFGKHAAREALPAFVAAGALLLGAVYFAAMFLSNRRDRGSLLLSLLSLGVLVQLTAKLARAVISYPYPLHILRLEIILVAAAVSGLLLVAYVAALFELRRRRTLLALSALAMAVVALAVPGFDGKTEYLILVALLAVAGASLAARRRTAASMLTAAVAIALAVWLVTGPRRFLDRDYYLAMAALLLFLFAQQVRALRRAQRVRAAAELRSARLELELLKRQIQPHFLMNSLTALSEWIEADPRAGVRMIEALAGEFRAFAAMSDRQLVTLAEELELCRRHLDVMGYRSDRTFALIADGAEPGERLPPGLLHTLIENALTHNAYANGAVFELEAARTASGRRIYRLRSPHEARPRERHDEGRGHAYVKARLSEAFGEDWSFASGPEGGEWIDTIELPGAP